MRLSPVSGNFCCAQNPNFRAKFSQETLNNIAKESSQLNNNIDSFGSKNTEVTIVGPKEFIQSHMEYPSSGYYGFSGEQGPVIEPDEIEYSVYSADLKFCHPELPDMESSKSLTLIADTNNQLYKFGAEQVSKDIVEKGETRLLLKYADRIINTFGVSSESVKSAVEKIKGLDFSEMAVKNFVKYIKTMDLKNKIDTQISHMKKI